MKYQEVAEFTRLQARNHFEKVLRRYACMATCILYVLYMQAFVYKLVLYSCTLSHTSLGKGACSLCIRTSTHLCFCVMTLRPNISEASASLIHQSFNKHQITKLQLSSFHFIISNYYFIYCVEFVYIQCMQL